MLCPHCFNTRCRRSRRQSATDIFLAAAGLRPWRCIDCKGRFYARTVPLRYIFVAHCSRCGNFDLQRISRQHMGPWMAKLFRIAHIPTYRCAPCRHRFSSSLPLRRFQPPDLPEEQESPSEHQMESANAE